jgi:predicted RNase H-like nuclease (RuvC/YqgF family)
MLGQQSVDVAECLMGHHGYLTEAYRKYPNPEKTLAEFYKQNEHLLWIFTEAEEITKLKKELDERFETLQALNEKLQLENLDLRRHLQEQTERIKVLEELAHEAKGIFDFLEKQGIVPQSFTEKEGG